MNLSKKIKRRVRSNETVRARKILEALTNHGELSAASIARNTMLSFRPVSRTLTALVQRGRIISRIEPSMKRKEPPRVFYRLNPDYSSLETD